MRAGAELRFATDDVDYLTWSLECLTRHPDFRWTARWPNDLRQRPGDWPRTRYEAKALLAGRLPNFLVFRRGARDGAGD
jgi:tRNA (guanine-N7-)-methyltransferase